MVTLVLGNEWGSEADLYRVGFCGSRQGLQSPATRPQKTSASHTVDPPTNANPACRSAICKLNMRFGLADQECTPLCLQSPRPPSQPPRLITATKRTTDSCRKKQTRCRNTSLFFSISTQESNNRNGNRITREGGGGREGQSERGGRVYS
ncbi:hypothetical protein L1887_57803 [Cichorium endivia]|nr:hypothetical protein L1887_57803 [Cichorium endivia]